MLTESAKQYAEKSAMFGDLRATDPELYEILCNFAFGEVLSERPLEDRTRHLAVLAALIGSQARELFSEEVTAALAYGVKPAEIREVIYQSFAYLGAGRALPFVGLANACFIRAGIALPLEGGATVNYPDRTKAGEDKQVEIFGGGMRGFASRGGKTGHVNAWLSANCFGDYYTRKYLSDKDREMVTFCYLLSQGGCEPQLTSHAAANLKIGNDEQFLISVVSNCLPYVGYPRSLNALTCVENAVKSLS